MIISRGLPYGNVTNIVSDLNGIVWIGKLDIRVKNKQQELQWEFQALIQIQMNGDISLVIDSFLEITLIQYVKYSMNNIKACCG